MKVAYINCLSSRHGSLGIEKKIEAQTRAIQDLGLNMEVFFFDQAKRCEDPIFTFYPQGNSFVARWFSVFHRYSQIHKRIDLKQYDFLVLRYAGGDLSAFSSLFRGRGTRIVTEHHTKELPEAYTYRSSPPQRMLTIAMERYLGPRILRKCHGLIAVTEEIKAYELGRVASPIPACTIPNGISVDDIPFSRHASYDGSRLNMLCLANRFDPWQGLDRLIVGLSKYPNQKPALRLNVVGHVLPEHKALAGSLLGWESGRIRFLGRLEGEALDRVFKETHIAFSALAVFRKEMDEACALKTREFAARGVPFVLAHRDPDLKPGIEFVLSLPPDDTPVDMEKVVAFAKGVLNREGISRKIRSFAYEKLDWRVKMEQMWAFLQNLS
jgi:glycosyltransferase involved in cell wall biosynthesis